MILPFLSLASLALAQTQLNAPFTSLAVGFKGTGNLRQTYEDIIEVKLGFELDATTTETIPPGDFFDMVIDGMVTTSPYSFEVLDSLGAPVFVVSNFEGNSFRAAATDYFLENAPQSIEGERCV